MNSLSVQSYYHIVLGSIWKDKEYDVQIVGIANKNTVAELDKSVNLKKEFFTDYNLSISKYLLLLTDSTLVYVARPIKSYDPIEIDEEERYFIPASLINYASSYEYMTARKYNFNVSTGVKKFDTSLSEDAFFQSATVEISKAVNDIDNFMSDNVSVDVSYTDVLTTLSDLEVIEENRNKLISYKTNATKQDKDNRETMERNLYNMLKDAETSIQKYDDARVTLVSQINGVNALQTANEQENALLTSVKAIMIELIGLIKSGSYSPDSFPSFDELYQQAKSELSSK